MLATKNEGTLDSRSFKPGPPGRERNRVHLELPNGLGQSEEDLHRLIENWIVPQLIRAFVAEINFERQVEIVMPDTHERLSKDQPSAGRILDL